MRTGGRRCLRPGNTIRNGGMPRAVVEAVQPWRTSFEGSMADMKAGSRVPKERDTGRISNTLPPGSIPKTALLTHLRMLSIGIIRWRRRWICAMNLMNGGPCIRTRRLRNITECLRAVQFISGRCSWIACVQPMVFNETYSGCGLMHLMKWRLTRDLRLGCR